MKQLLFLWICFLAGLIPLHAQSRMTIGAPRVLDGRGKLLRDAVIVIEGNRIVEIRTGVKEADLYLKNSTLMPGLIDTHVHISWHFDPETGKSHEAETAEETDHSLPFALSNAYHTLMGGFTTVQSVGTPTDGALKKWIDQEGFPGPRVLTSLEQIYDEKLTPDQLRVKVVDLKKRGADVIKVFASQSIRDGGGPTYSQEQMDAVCGEAKSQGLRSVVHAHGPESARRAALAGCSSVEHGALLDAETLQFLAGHHVVFDPNIGLIYRNYFENKDKYLGTGNYTEDGFEKMKEAVPLSLNVFRKALKTSGLKVVFGSDAVAGAHGRNIEELIYRVNDAGQPAMDALVAATSLSAESLGLGERLGTIASGYEADLIAVDGDPLNDIAAMRRVRLVMRGGTIYSITP